MCLWFVRAHRLRRVMGMRVPLSDDDFVAQIDWAGHDCRPAILVRRALAKCWNISPEVIYADDVFQNLAEVLSPIGWDELEFIFALELQTGFKVRRGSINFPSSHAGSIGWLSPQHIGPRVRVSEWTCQVASQLLRPLESSP